MLEPGDSPSTAQVLRDASNGVGAVGGSYEIAELVAFFHKPGIRLHNRRDNGGSRLCGEQWTTARPPAFDDGRPVAAFCDKRKPRCGGH